MSVINKMLRDLDSRNARATIKKAGVHSVPPVAVRDRRVVSVASGSAIKVLSGVLVVVLLAVGAWKAGLVSRWVTPQPVAADVAAIAAPVAAPAAVPAAVPLPAVSAVSAPAPRASTSAAMPAVSAPTALVSAPAIAVSKPVPVQAAASAPQAPTSALKAAASGAAPAALAVQTLRQQTAAEAVATAQSLWNAGSRDAAIRLLNDVLLSAERSMAGTAGMPLGSGVLALVRELTRMQLADGRPGAAWDLLVRLEPQLRDEADLWAVRGNAAQRLGRHPDSVLAYMTALQLRPTEQRWMLGAAVSLAAAGKTPQAAAMVEKAQALGPISSDVQGYLRQMGVPLQD